MLKTILGRYLLFVVLGIESLLLPYFLSKEVYGEVEFYKYTGFLAQFLLLGAGTGYVVRYLKKSKQNRIFLTSTFIIYACIFSILVGIIIFLGGDLPLAVLSTIMMIAMVFESTLKVKEKYILAMSFKPLLSVMLISTLPLLLVLDWDVESYILMASTMAIIVYFVIARRMLKLEISEKFQERSIIKSISEFFRNIKSGVVMNASTAMMFAFFYIDRAIVRDKFPDLLGDYSLSFAITQLTIVAITTFSYVNLIEFGKEAVGSLLFKQKILLAFKKCLILYLLIGIVSIVFSFGAEQFYKYEQVFETTSLMVLLFGLANVFCSLNAAHLYLGSVNIMTMMMLATILVSIGLNWLIPLSSSGDYYILLGKTYGLFLLFSISSSMYVYFKLNIATKKTKE